MQLPTLDALTHLTLKHSAQDLTGSGAVLAMTLSLDEAALAVQQQEAKVTWGVGAILESSRRKILVIMLPSPYAYWQRIYGRKLYDTEQLQVAGILTDFLEKLYPGIRQDIEVTDVATPLSYERYTGNWQGSSCGWLLTKETMMLMIQNMEKTLPGLKNFYLAGQWVEPGGSVPLAAASGRNAVHLVCARDGKEFHTI